MAAAGDDWRCRRHLHLAQPRGGGGGVCPHCLRDRLLRLCPDCACPRPCACASSPSSSSPSTTTSSSGGALGRVHSLIERERRVARSRSGRADGDQPTKSRVWGWVSFRKPAEAGCRDVEEEYDDAVALARSRSVAAGAAEAKGAASKAASGWGRLIPGKIKALRRRKSSAVR